MIKQITILSVIFVFTISVNTTGQVNQWKVLDYDEYGNPLEVQDANEVKTSYDWNYDGQFPIGSFVNAQVEYIFAHSFAYDSLNGFPDPEDLDNGVNTEWSIVGNKLEMHHSGTYATNLNNDYLTVSATDPITSRTVMEFDASYDESTYWTFVVAIGGDEWTGNNTGSTENLVWTSFKYGAWYYYDSGWHLIKNDLSPNTVYNFKIVADPTTDKADFYVDGKKLITAASQRANTDDISRIAFGNYGESTSAVKWHIDNIRMYPENAQATTQEIDPLWSTPVSIKDISGNTNRFKYDEFGRLHKTFNANNALITTNSYYYSLEENTSYDSSDPNRVETWTHYDPDNSSNVTKSISYFDGLGREIQTQTRGGGETIISSTMYNQRGLPEIVSRPFEISNQNSFVEHADAFGASFSPQGAVGSGSELYADYTGVSGGASYPYTYTAYENNPLARKNIIQVPGWSNYRSIISYSLNSTETFMIKDSTWHQYELNKTVTRDPDDKETITYTDGWGQTIASGVDMNGDGRLNGSGKDSCSSSNCDLITEFKYDLQGNLVRVEDPKGLITEYDYNELGRLVRKDLPDHNDDVNYKYDDKGRLRFVENAAHKELGASKSYTLSPDQSGAEIIRTIDPGKSGVLSFDIEATPFDGGYFAEIQDDDNGNEPIVTDFAGNDGGYPVTVAKKMLVRQGGYRLYADLEYSGDFVIDPSTGTLTFEPFKFSYKKYDNLDRPIEEGEYYGSTSFSSANPNSQTFPSSDYQKLVEYKYDQENAYTGASNVQGKLAEVRYYDPNDLSVSGKTYYSYNTLGLVEWVKQQIPGTSLKTIEYLYDELGRITRVFFNPSGIGDDHYFWYSYDEQGRLSTVKSYGTNNEGAALIEAEYTYNPDGQVKQLNLGDGAQFVDYDYTVQGWMDDLNNGATSGTDVFGMNLGYDDNGNINLQEWKQKGISSTLFKYYYTYDDANRLKSACFASSGCSSSMSSYDVFYDYDFNGNITEVARLDSASNDRHKISSVSFHTNTNKISSVSYSDIGNGSGTRNLSYDEMGNMVSNQIQELENATYDWRNLPTWMVAGTQALLYTYDADGQRVKKELVDGSTTYYIRGADGQTLAAYDDSGNLLFINILAGGQIIGQIDN